MTRSSRAFGAPDASRGLEAELPKNAGVHRRDEGLLRVRRITGWLVAGAVGLTALLAAVTAAATPGAKAGSSSSTQNGTSATPDPGSSADQGLQPLPGDSGSQSRPADTSSGGS
jgi:hypothetical protein